MSRRGIAAIARVTFLEAARQKFAQFLVLVALGFLGAALLFRQFNFGIAELKFIVDLGFGCIIFFGTLLAVVLSSQTLFADLENRTAYTILARPLGRPHFLIGKYLGLLQLLASFVILMTVLLTGMVFLREAELVALNPGIPPGGGAVRYLEIPIYALMQFLKLMVVVAITFLVASFSRSSLYTIVVALLVVVVAHLQYLAAESYRADAAVLLRLFAAVIAVLFPNFQVFNIGELMITAGEDSASGVATFRIALYAMLYALAYFGAAVVFFQRREL